MSTLLAAALLTLGGAAGATPIFDEEMDGPVSTDPNTPTIISLFPGQNEIILSFGPGDTFNFIELVFNGLTLTQLILNDFQTGAGNAASLLANCAPGVCNPFAALASEPINGSKIGMDLLPALLSDLGPGESLSNRWVLAETQADTTVSLIFVTVPEPGLILLLGGGTLAMALRRRAPTRA